MASVAPAVTSTSRVGIELDPVPAPLVVDDRAAQLGDPGARRVLVVTGADGGHRGVGDLARAVGVGEALAEVDRRGRDRERRHLGEDRLAELPHAGDEEGRAVGHAPRSVEAPRPADGTSVVVEAEAHLHRHLEPADRALVERAPDVGDLEPAEVPQRRTTRAPRRCAPPRRHHPATSPRSR